MPASFYIAIISALLAAGFFVIWRKVRRLLKEDQERYKNAKVENGSRTTYSQQEVRAVDSDLIHGVFWTRVSFWFFTALAALMLLNAAVSTVPTKNVGIVSQFKAQTGRTTGAGLQIVYPWQKVDNWEASRQTFDHLHQDRAVQVRIVGLQQAWVEIKIEWSVKPEQAPEQWAAYKEHDFEIFVDRRINPNITFAINEAYESHNPLSNVDVDTGAINPPLKQPFIDAIRKNIESRLGKDITVHDVVIGFVKYDDNTQDQISKYQQKVLEGRNLDVDLANAKKRQEINDQYKKRDPRTWCLEIAEAKGTEPGLCMGVTATPVLPVK